jgi:hypothetical protein
MRSTAECLWRCILFTGQRNEPLQPMIPLWPRCPSPGTFRRSNPARSRSRPPSPPPAPGRSARGGDRRRCWSSTGWRKRLWLGAAAGTPSALPGRSRMPSQPSGVLSRASSPGTQRGKSSGVFGSLKRSLPDDRGRPAPSLRMLLSQVSCLVWNWAWPSQIALAAFARPALQEVTCIEGLWYPGVSGRR